MLKHLFLLLLLINLFSCTYSQVKNIVTEDNWLALGEYQGEKGGIEHTLNELQALSDKYSNGEVDYSAYQQGYEKALIIYCQPQNAFQLGISGKHYNGVCERFPHGNEFRGDWEMAEKAKSGGM